MIFIKCLLRACNMYPITSTYIFGLVSNFINIITTTILHYDANEISKCLVQNT